ncbi:hypothetical protein GCM10010435_44260 [Winogradskya consettensis]|uniref:Terminase n=1 Tax=Winogradskya consettensis TaxID=113560 RepID=A0A919T1V1_9ACTN|nr:hypothetical protein [Actinoplanes consettensis]GIM82664.1 hypothetical protein Aco04nite_82650 [Actinoplanes consettensis]
MPAEPNPYVVDFPTLWVVPAWIQRHCIIPDGFRKGRPFRPYDWQLWCTANHYRIKPEAQQDPDYLIGDPDAIPIRSEAFHYRRSQVIAPQKTGKGPWSAAWVAAEGLGPVLFYDWAGENDAYVCEDVGCDCGWVYRYKPGEPMGHAWPTPLIQLLATSEDQVDNVYRPLQAMARGPRLKGRMLVREGFIRLRDEDGDPDQNRIDVVTSSAQSRLGNPITFCLQDESQLYTTTNKLVSVAQTMRRGAAAMGGRSGETTNCFNPAENSTAQMTHQSSKKDIFRFYEPPPADLKYELKADRLRIHAFNYRGSPHADLHGINAEAEELMETDKAQAERFYGNRLVYGASAWLDGDLWDGLARLREVPDRTVVVGGFDGSDSDDWTGIRLQTREGYQFTPKFADGRPMVWDPKMHKGQVPRLEVRAAMAEVMSRFQVVRLYADPPWWSTEIDDWAEEFGDTVVVRWSTFRTTQMHAAAQRLLTDVGKAAATFRHDGCEITKVHVRNARKSPRTNERYVLEKPSQAQKIDMAVVSILCNEAAGDVTADQLWTPPSRLTKVTGRVRGY